VWAKLYKGTAMNRQEKSMGRANNFITIVTVLLLVLFSGSLLSACEIYFKVVGEEKETYEIGDEIVVLLEVKFTHRVCPEGIEHTDFATDGIDITAATKWKEPSLNVWQRKLKLRVEGNEKGNLMLSATRTCDKEGGFGTIDFQATPLKVAAKETTAQADKN